MQSISQDKKSYPIHDNIAVEYDFEKMCGDSIVDLIDDDASGEVRLFQAVILGDLLKRLETPQDFIKWLHTKHARIYCDIANLRPSYLERIVKSYM